WRDGGEPPRLIHQIDVRAEFLPRADAVTGVGFGAQTEVGTERLRLEFPPHLHAVVETAGGQHHPAPCRDCDLTAVVVHDRAAHAATVALEAQPRGVGP